MGSVQTVQVSVPLPLGCVFKRFEDLLTINELNTSIFSPFVFKIKKFANCKHLVLQSDLATYIPALSQMPAVQLFTKGTRNIWWTLLEC